MLERIAAPAKENPRDIERAIEHKNYDFMRFRVNASGDSIPLESAATVINSAFGMIRAAATAARRPTQTIKNYVKAGDEIAAQARLGHTEVGSFVFPVLLHINEPEPPEEATLEGVDQIIPESDERRVTRTLAQALDAFERQVVDPGTAPTPRSLLPVVYAGGTKELLSKVATALAEPDISFFETSFIWAGAEPASKTLPRSVAIPAEARELLTDAARVLGRSNQDPLRVLVGPIIRIEYIKGEVFGEIVIQAPGPSGGRKSRVEMRVRADQLGVLHEWMHGGTTVVVQGKVQTRPGRYAFLEGIAEPQPLSATLEGVQT
ncbi:hypothetical protein ASD56_07500 [Microbacterium sp. Root166]|uniref:hypothetical protein n=1 Tax=Microbacterium sp. Root166 TaxID=1736478 RepID=UPI0006FE1652|nr:hypothetical protein [Microbacterium sp. Root166]KQZ86097.1 hypothetical protein ASD56_07500 [Microbacterium sp. Root166]